MMSSHMVQENAKVTEKIAHPYNILSYLISSTNWHLKKSHPHPNKSTWGAIMMLELSGNSWRSVRRAHAFTSNAPSPPHTEVPAPSPAAYARGLAPKRAFLLLLDL